jgi:hypothetical protein
MKNGRRFLLTELDSLWKNLSETLQKFYFQKFVSQQCLAKQKCKHWDECMYMKNAIFGVVAASENFVNPIYVIWKGVTSFTHAHYYTLHYAAKKRV